MAGGEGIGNPMRLLHPLRRERGGRDDWRRVGWDEALDHIAGRCKAVGREAVGLWSGHGIFTNNYGTRINGQLTARFANLYGCQWWNPSMICWGLGGFGVGLTGVLEVHTKEDMGRHAEMIVLWGANLASQPNTSRHLLAAKKRGAYVVTVDVRRTEAAGQSDETLIVRPGTDAALALGLMHVIVAESLHDAQFVARHTEGFEQLAAHLRQYTPQWAAAVTGIDAERITALARRYAATRPAMIVLGGSSMHKGSNGWQAARAIACLPALTGNLGIAGAGLGPRHGGASHGQARASVAAPERKPPGHSVPNQLSEITASLRDGRVKALLLLGTNMLSSFPDARMVAEGLARTELIVSHDLFMNDTARQFADVVLPATCWLEELGCKMTNTHLYLMEQALEPPGETRPLAGLLSALAERLGVGDFFPWASGAELIDAILDHPYTGHATVASLRAGGGFAAVNASPLAYPDHRYHTPSGKVEFHSAQAESLGLPPLPVHQAEGEHGAADSRYPLTLAQGRTLAHLHGFYLHPRALPTPARPPPHHSPSLAPRHAPPPRPPPRLFRKRPRPAHAGPQRPGPVPVDGPRRRPGPWSGTRRAHPHPQGAGQLRGPRPSDG